jgi:hypothetical protein
MAEQQVQHPLPPAPADEQSEAAGARPLLDAVHGRRALPLKDFGGDAAVAQRLGGMLRLGRGLRAQPMVDDQSGDPAAAAAGPGIGKQAKGGAVGAAGNADGEPGRRLEGLERRHQGGERGGIDGRRVRRSGVGQGHPRRFTSAARLSSMRFGACGKARLSSANVVHASSLRPIWASDMPSLSSESGAFEPSFRAW